MTNLMATKKIAPNLRHLIYNYLDFLFHEENSQ